MIKRWLIYGLLVSALLLFSAAYLLVDTATGLRIVMQTVVTAIPLPLTYENLQGTVLSTIRADRAQYKDENVIVNIEEFETQFSLRKLLSGRLGFRGVRATDVEVVLLEGTAATPPPDDGAAGGASDEYLPIPITVKDVALKKLRIADEQQPIYDFSEVGLGKARILDEVAFEELAFTVEAGSVRATGAVGFSESAAVQLEARWRSQALEHFPETRGTASIIGTYQQFTVNSQITAPEELTLQGEVEDLFSQFNWKANVTGARLQLSLFRPDIATELHDFAFSAKGDLDELALEGRSELWDARLGKWASEVSGRLNAKQIELRGVKLASLESPATISITGSTLQNFSYEKQGPFKVNASWENFQWPPVNTPVVQSQAGQLEITGVVQDYQVRLGNAALAIDAHQVSSISVSGKGNEKSLNITEFKANYLSGLWQGDGRLDWENDFQWRATVSVKGLDPSSQWPQWTANLDSSATINGYHKADGWHLAGQIKKLGGKLTGVPIDYGSLAFELAENQYTVKDLKFKSGKNQLRGAVQVKLLSENKHHVNANWSIDAQNLSRLFPEAKGTVRSQGNLRGELTSPQLSTSIHAQGVVYKSYQLAALDGTVNLNPSINSELLIDVKANGLVAGENAIQQLRINGRGTTGEHELVLKSTLDEKRLLQLTAKGAYANEAWSGKLVSSTLNTAFFGEWKQHGPANANVSVSRLNIDNYCLVPASASGRLCLQLNTDDMGGWAGKVNMQKLPVAAFSKYLPPQIISVEGVVEGSADFHFQENMIKELQARLVSKNGNVVYGLAAGEKQEVKYRQVLANISHSEQGIVVESKLDLQETGGVDINVLLKDKHTLSALDTSQNIQGRLVVNLKNLTILPLILTDIQYIEGRKFSEYAVTGTIGDPVIVGHSDITVSSVTLPRLGIELKDVKVTASSDKYRNIKVKGEAHSGDGKISINGEMTDYRKPDLLATINIEGENFLAAKLPEISIAVSPKLTAVLKKDALRLDGELGIPKAHIQILQSAATVSPSADVVIVNGEEEVGKPKKKFDFSAEVKVKLGHDVKLEGFGVSSRLRGEVLVREDPDGTTQGTGEITFAEGRYSAYNRELVIDSGRLTYASSPIDNPIVAIKAMRKIDDKTNVGVLVTGHAQSPKVELFSEPAMDQSDILSYMVLGYPMSQATKSDGSTLSSAAGSIGLIGGEILAKQIADKFGIDDVKVTSDSTTQQTSLALGKYLSPRLYAQYAMGIGQAVNTFRIEYELTSRWVLKTEASSEQQGADLFYTIEFD
ncbi:translocation/assembly module TamB domain-containing protein [Kaarinaea lacus]